MIKINVDLTVLWQILLLSVLRGNRERQLSVETEDDKFPTVAINVCLNSSTTLDSQVCFSKEW